MHKFSYFDTFITFLYIFILVINQLDAQILYCKTFIQWRIEEGVAVFNHPRNSEGPPKSCQTQPDCENC